MPEPVSPADTIRRAERMFREAKVPSDRFGHLPRWTKADLDTLESLLNMADALLAVEERDKADAQIALDALPDPMHPEMPKRWVDGIVAAQILLATIAGHDDPGNVEAVRERGERDGRQIARLTEALRIEVADRWKASHPGAIPPSSLVDRLVERALARAVLAGEEGAGDE